MIDVMERTEHWFGDELYPARDVVVVLMHMERAVRSIGVGATD
jgi:hypothetical protein